MWRSHRRRFRNAFCGATPGARGSEVADDTTRRSSSSMRWFTFRSRHRDRLQPPRMRKDICRSLKLISWFSMQRGTETRTRTRGTRSMPRLVERITALQCETTSLSTSTSLKLETQGRQRKLSRMLGAGNQLAEKDEFEANHKEGRS